MKIDNSKLTKGQGPVVDRNKKVGRFKMKLLFIYFYMQFTKITNNLSLFLCCSVSGQEKVNEFLEIVLTLKAILNL